MKLLRAFSYCHNYHFHPYYNLECVFVSIVLFILWLQWILIAPSTTDRDISIRDVPVCCETERPRLDPRASSVAETGPLHRPLQSSLMKSAASCQSARATAQTEMLSHPGHTLNLIITNGLSIDISTIVVAALSDHHYVFFYYLFAHSTE